VLYRDEGRNIPEGLSLCSARRRNETDLEAVLHNMRSLFFFRHPWSSLSGFAALVVLSSMAVHPFGSVKRTDGKGVHINDLKMPLEVKNLFERSCRDCHSSQTVWPWYSYVAPTSWMVERDVRHGRDHMNLSYWPQYSLNRQEKLLAEIATVVKNREMPLPQYTLIHKEAKLSDAELDVLYHWARMERRNVKAALAQSSQSADWIGRPIPSVTVKRSSQPSSPHSSPR
jgi:hypothetical protein